MKSTMGDDLPLTVTSILRHGATWYGGREVVTAEMSRPPAGCHTSRSQPERPSWRTPCARSVCALPADRAARPDAR